MYLTDNGNLSLCLPKGLNSGSLYHIHDCSEARHSEMSLTPLLVAQHRPQYTTASIVEAQLRLPIQ